MGMEGKFPPPLFFVSLVFFPQPNSRKYHFPLYFPLPIFHPPYFHPTKHTLRVCLFGGEKMVDGKLLRENGKENFFGVCLVGWGGMKIDSRAWVFSPQTHQKVFSQKWRENRKEKMRLLNGQKCPYAIRQIPFFFFFFFLFLCFHGQLPLPFSFFFFSFFDFLGCGCDGCFVLFN